MAARTSPSARIVAVGQPNVVQRSARTKAGRDHPTAAFVLTLANSFVAEGRANRGCSDVEVFCTQKNKHNEDTTGSGGCRKY
ncbi:hypothetical protein D918_00911 [Trichuris suis]|nr:hypothetical protein D918_00911 [Trichuris suis]